ncbi:MAG TPA: transketolase family protein [bacterium]
MEKMEATRDAYGKILLKLGEMDERIVVLDADLSSSTKTGVFAKKFPHRFFNMGVAEQNLMGTAAGLSAVGKIPFVSTFAIFASGRAWEPVRQSIAYSKFNVKIVATHGGITVGEDGASHQALEDVALMRAIPGMIVIIPADSVETEKAIDAVYRYEGPVYMRLSRAKFPVIFDENYNFKIGKGMVLMEGRDVAILSAGLMVANSMAACEILKRENISAAVVNISTIKPIDVELIKNVAAGTGAVVTCEEHSIIGGLGSAVAEVLAEEVNVPLVRVGVRDRFGLSGTAEDLIRYFHFSPEDIADAAREAIKKKNARK